MKKLELILSISFLLGLSIDFFLSPHRYAGISNGILLIIGGFSLASFYMILGFVLWNGNYFKQSSHQLIDGSRMNKVLAICTGLLLAMTIVGILFKYLMWPDSFNLPAGLIGLLLVLVISSIKYFQTQSIFYLEVLKRVIVVGVLGLTLWSLPLNNWQQIKLRNYPQAYKDAIKAADKDPTNEALWDKVREEEEKMFQKD